MLRVLVQAARHKLLEGTRVSSLELGRVVPGNEEEDPHGVEVSVGGLPVGQLDRRDAQRPNVRFGVIGGLLDDLGGHPEGSSHKRVPVQGVRQLPGNTKVSQLHISVL